MLNECFRELLLGQNEWHLANENSPQQFSKVLLCEPNVAETKTATVIAVVDIVVIVVVIVAEAVVVVVVLE